MQVGIYVTPIYLQVINPLFSLSPSYLYFHIDINLCEVSICSMIHFLLQIYFTEIFVKP